MTILHPRMTRPLASDSSFFTFMYALTSSGTLSLKSGQPFLMNLMTVCISLSLAVAILILSILLGEAGMPSTTVAM